MAELPTSFYEIPKHARTTMTTKDVRAALLATDGRIFAAGESWDIIAKQSRLASRGYFPRE